MCSFPSEQSGLWVKCVCLANSSHYLVLTLQEDGLCKSVCADSSLKHGDVHCSHTPVHFVVLTLLRVLSEGDVGGLSSKPFLQGV